MPFDGTRGIQFTFLLQRIKPAGGVGPLLRLPAYFKNIGDTSSPTWEASQDIGRADPKVMYQTFSRTINFVFDVVAENDQRDEQYLKDTLDEIGKMSTPYYIDGYGFAGHYVKFTVGKLYRAQYGYLTNYDVQFNNEQISWGLDSQLPYFASVNMTINWIGKRRPDQNMNYYG